MFELKDYELLHRYKIKSNFDDLPITSQYFYTSGDKIIFVKKSRKYYQVAANSMCGFEPAFRMSCFDILYQNEDLQNVVSMFHSYVSRLVCN